MGAGTLEIYAITAEKFEILHYVSILDLEKI